MPRAEAWSPETRSQIADASLRQTIFASLCVASDPRSVTPVVSWSPMAQAWGNQVEVAPHGFHPPPDPDNRSRFAKSFLRCSTLRS